MDLKCGSFAYDLVEDDLLPVDKYEINGDDIQKLSVIQGLPQLLQTEPAATFSRIIPRILNELPSSSCEFQVICSRVFRVLMEKQVPPNLLHAVMQGIESKDPLVSTSWMDTLLSCVSQLSSSQVKTEIFQMAQTKSQLNQPIQARIGACKILGKLAAHKAFEPLDVKKDILPLSQSLCQDCHPDVRASMCIQLPYIAQGLGNILIKTTMLTSLVELASDDHMGVRASSISSIVMILPYITPEIKKSTIFPLLKQICDKSIKSDDLTITAIAKEIGKLVDGLQVSLTVSDGIWFLFFYKSVAHRGLSSDVGGFRSALPSVDVGCRQNCAANLPMMSNFTFTTLPAQVDLLYSVFKDLAADPCYIVRRTVAGCICDVAKIFGAQSKLLRGDMVRLLRDDSEDVLQSLIPNLGQTLEVFCTYGTLSRSMATASTVEMGRALIKCQYELSSGYNWRLLTNFLYQLEHLPNCMPPEFIHQHFTPVILNNAVQGRAKPVRMQAVRTLLIFLRYNNKEMQRKWLRDSLVAQLCYSQNFYTRHIFIKLCLNAMEIFSERYFKEYFYESLLDLADDPVPNIRLCVAANFAILKQMLKDEDSKLDERLKGIFDKYGKKEKDKDVIEVYKRSMEDIKKNKRVNTLEEHQKDQKRKQEEEDRVASGGRTNVIMAPRRSLTTKPMQLPQRTASITRPSNESAPMKAVLPKSQSVSPKTMSPTLTTPSDMTFLKQHFYIDAGVDLPVQDKPDAGKSDDTYEGNITDDDKVTLRRLKKGDRSKRYSSVAAADFHKAADKRLNRRSLNLPSAESRIPISRSQSGEQCTKSKEGTTQEQTASKERSKKVQRNSNANDSRIMRCSKSVKLKYGVEPTAEENEKIGHGKLRELPKLRNRTVEEKNTKIKNTKRSTQIRSTEQNINNELSAERNNNSVDETVTRFSDQTKRTLHEIDVNSINEQRITLDSNASNGLVSDTSRSKANKVDSNSCNSPKVSHLPVLKRTRPSM